MRHLAVSAVLFVTATPFAAAAQAYQCRVPARVAVPDVRPDGPARRMPVTGYVLALSWAPEFCRGANGAQPTRSSAPAPTAASA